MFWTSVPISFTRRHCGNWGLNLEVLATGNNWDSRAINFPIPDWQWGKQDLYSAHTIGCLISHLFQEVPPALLPLSPRMKHSFWRSGEGWALSQRRRLQERTCILLLQVEPLDWSPCLLALPDTEEHQSLWIQIQTGYEGYLDSGMWQICWSSYKKRGREEPDFTICLPANMVEETLYAIKCPSSSHANKNTSTKYPNCCKKGVCSLSVCPSVCLKTHTQSIIIPNLNFN